MNGFSHCVLCFAKSNNSRVLYTHILTHTHAHTTHNYPRHTHTHTCARAKTHNPACWPGLVYTHSGVRRGRVGAIHHLKRSEYTTVIRPGAARDTPGSEPASALREMPISNPFRHRHRVQCRRYPRPRHAGRPAKPSRIPSDATSSNARVATTCDELPRCLSQTVHRWWKDLSRKNVFFDSEQSREAVGFTMMRRVYSKKFCQQRVRFSRTPLIRIKTEGGLVPIQKSWLPCLKIWNFVRCLIFVRFFFFVIEQHEL